MPVGTFCPSRATVNPCRVPPSCYSEQKRACRVLEPLAPFGHTGRPDATAGILTLLGGDPGGGGRLGSIEKLLAGV